MTIAELQRIKRWHVTHRSEHPLEYHLWDAMLTLWLVGWVGFLPALAFGAVWVAPLCAVAAAAPSLYVMWRMRAHRLQRVRCDWLHD